MGEHRLKDMTALEKIDAWLASLRDDSGEILLSAAEKIETDPSSVAAVLRKAAGEIKAKKTETSSS